MANINPVIEESWKQVLWEEFNAPYFAHLKDFLVKEKQQYKVFPPGNQIFNAFNLTPLDKVKVVLLGQDPYHDDGQAEGLCFSVAEGVSHPKSLINIFKELHDDIGCPVPRSGSLRKWANQGVLLLNATLTVRAHEAGSHQNQGWETFTDAVIRAVSQQKEHVVFLLWGRYAQNKLPLIDTTKHLALQAAHPSPLAALKGFFGCRHFSKANQWLVSQGLTPVDWSL